MPVLEQGRRHPALCIVSTYLNTTNRHAGDMHTNSLNIMTGVCSSAAI